MDTKKLIFAILITFSFIVVMSLITILFSFDLGPVFIAIFYITGVPAIVYFMLQKGENNG